MEKKKIIPTWVSIVMILLCVTAIVLNIRGFISSKDNMIQKVVYYIVPTLSAMLATTYCAIGYQKKSYMFYRCSIGLFGISEFLLLVILFIYQIIPSRMGLLADPKLFAYLGECICLMILAIGENLGNVFSKILAFIILAISIIMSIAITFSNGFGPDFGIQFTNIVLALAVIIMVFAKYADKKNRGTK